MDYKNQQSLWTGTNQAIEVTSTASGVFSGGSGIIDVDFSDERAFNVFREINSNVSTSVKGRIGDELRLILTVGARQKLKLFGRNNSNLSGSAVVNSGGINIVETTLKLRIPMLPKFQPACDNHK